MPRCFLAFDNESMITVSPNTFPNASLYLGSNLTKSCAKPTAPDFFEINIAAALGGDGAHHFADQDADDYAFHADDRQAKQN